MGVLMGDTGKFRQAENFIISDIGNGNITPKWQHMMLAHRPDFHASNRNHLVVLNGGKCRIKLTCIIFNKFTPEIGDAARRFNKAFTRWVFAKCGE